MKIKVLHQNACGISSGNGSNFSSATHVRVHNSGTTNRLVSIENSSNTLIGTFTLGGGATEIIVKNPSDEVLSNAEVLGVGIAVEQ